MATELRRVIFSNDEIIEAIKNYNEAAKKRLPDGSIVSCRIDAGDGLKLTPEMRDHAVSKLYRVADKTLEVVGDNLSISMTMNLRADELLEGGDGRVRVHELPKLGGTVAIV